MHTKETCSMEHGSIQHIERIIPKRLLYETNLTHGCKIYSFRKKCSNLKLMYIPRYIYHFDIFTFRHIGFCFATTVWFGIANFHKNSILQIIYLLTMLKSMERVILSLLD